MNAYDEAKRRHIDGGFPVCKCGATGVNLTLTGSRLEGHDWEFECGKCGFSWDHPTDAELARKLVRMVDWLAARLSRLNGGVDWLEMAERGE